MWLLLLLIIIWSYVDAAGHPEEEAVRDVVGLRNRCRGFLFQISAN